MKHSTVLMIDIATSVDSFVGYRQLYFELIGLFVPLSLASREIYERRCRRMRKQAEEHSALAHLKVYVDLTSRAQDSGIVPRASTHSATLHVSLWILRQSIGCLMDMTLNRVLHPPTPLLMLALCALAAKTSRSSTKLNR